MLARFSMRLRSEDITRACDADEKTEDPENHALLPSKSVEQRWQKQSREDVGECGQGQAKCNFRFGHSCRSSNSYEQSM